MAQPSASAIATRRRPSGPRVGELIEAFLDQLASGGGSTHTLGAYRRDLRGVADRMATARGLGDIAELRLSQVDAAGLEAGVGTRGTGPSPAPGPPAPGALGSFFTHLLSPGIA